MRPFIALACAAALSACATTSGPSSPAGAQAAARVTYTSVCGEVLRLRDAGKRMPSAIDACIKADDALDATELALKMGDLSSVTAGTQRALLLIGAAQAVLIAANGNIK
jgi:hypothetical protein